mmetsp:Transcript_5575/g.16044  ORF Transcript_5575/g.16044 Transcript_5575/m.16044 type:complete len:706 (-) Transcript_5575:441-2558(-)|eukprot:CAMPEP_0172370558 /NCGR_PEP_ID=MMETSP1060-20121228/38175_1 /TAXON_ID=37318 /ORGANISM="Pseudo-nitzschia pungens, Strain cf. cingulata" /LENGTH=705 /DNA_ID=CAMNT_0013095853 /DNA_START=29 /DNA_END=2146 /DNA_ORIENTATION=+
MKFQFTAGFSLLLLNASASSFAANSPRNIKRGWSSVVNGRIPFVSGGAITASSNDLGSTKLKSSVDSSPTAASVSGVVTEENLELLSDRGRRAILTLVEHDADGFQKHVYADWPEAGTDDDGKKRLAEQLADLDSSYPGGLAVYTSKARALLKESADGTNPFEDFEAVVSEGETLSYDGEGTMSFSEAEKIGMEGIAGAAFVLVAGGLGERLGYSGIKLSLETNLCTEECYLEVYIKYIKAVQHLARTKTGRDDVRIPLVIMTSGDTDQPTRDLLKANEYFGMDEDMVTIVMQDKVPALKNNNAALALDDDDRWTVQTKPHGHGDVHHLLYREGLVDQWEKEGRTHVVFLQDTNELVINSVIPVLGVSISKGFDMNSICIPRLAGEAAGAIVRLEHKSDPSKSLVINVEYNQLDPLLRSQGDCKGDVADPSTGYSPYPGNANNLVIALGAYAKTLRGEDQGVVLEFVNPKYKDETRTDFKKPTRLECMMQDIPKLFQKELGSDVNIGFTMLDRWFTFSPAKNSLESGIEAVEKGNTAPGTMSSAESDKYIQNQRKLKFAGVDLPVTNVPDDLVPVGGIPVASPGPRVVLAPSFAISQDEILQKIQGENKITARSSLVLEGHNLSIKNLDLDGALVIKCGDDTHVTVDGLKVQNKGWELVENDAETDYPENVSIRGYTMAKLETKEYILNEPGSFVIGEDGEVKKI